MPLISTCVAGLVRDRRAAVAPTFGLLLVPLLGAMGFCVDLSVMLAEKTRAQNIADAGSIDALRTVQTYMATNGNTEAVFNQIQSSAQTSANALMTGLTNQDANMVSAVPAVQLSYSPTTYAITSQATVNFQFKPAFMGIFGITNIAASVPATSTSALNRFTQVIFLVDVSESMGVGATDQVVQALQADPDITAGSGWNAGPCAFACHTNATISQDGSTDNRAVAKQKGYQLKIDSVQTAVQDFLTQLYAVSQSSPGHYSAGIYTFSNVLHTVVAPTLPAQTSFASLNDATSAIDLDLGSGVEPCWNNCAGWTNLTGALSSVKGELTNVGDGSSPTSMLTYVVVLTDGVEDTYDTSYWAGHDIDTTWASKCAAIKASGAQIATVQAIYYPLATNTAYQELVAPIASQIPGAFSTCASSSDLSLTATDGTGINTAVQNLFAKFTSTSRLTN
jgi:Flp pilus assembly protein TadG